MLSSSCVVYLTTLSRCDAMLLAWWASPWKNSVKHAEASLCYTSVWRYQGVRHTNLLCRSMPPLLPVTWKVDPTQISCCTLEWQSVLATAWELRGRCIQRTIFNKCAEKFLKASIPNSSLGTADGHKFHPKCMQTFISLLSDPWADAALLSHVPST